MKKYMRKKSSLGTSMSSLFSNAGSVTPIGAVVSTIGGIATDIINNKKRNELNNRINQIQHENDIAQQYTVGVNNANNIQNAINSTEDDITGRLAFKGGGKFYDRMKVAKLGCRKLKCGGKKKCGGKA